MLKHSELTGRIIGAAMGVHRELGPGLLESAYEEALAFELAQLGLNFQRQLSIPVRYKGHVLPCDYRIDVLVEAAVLIELKAIERILPIHQAQLLTYMKISKTEVGLLINFNVPLLKDGIIRRVL